VDLLKWLASFIPRDPETKAGLGPFELPESAAWMRPIFKYHDHFYEVGPASGMRLSEIDARIFRALAIAATDPSLDWMEQCKRAKDVCTYWPIMRSAGHYLYNRHAG
jgi:hypothetical protein